MRKRGWFWFWLWAIPGVALAFQVSVIGFLFVPAGLVAAVLLARFARPWPEGLGIGAGVGLACLAIALISVLRGDWPGGCPPSGEVVVRTRNSLMAHSCDRWFALPWLMAGLTMTLGVTFAYLIVVRQVAQSGRGESPTSS